MADEPRPESAAAAAAGKLRFSVPRLLRQGTAPFWHGSETSTLATWTWIAAALIPAGLAVVALGTAALSILAMSVATALLAETALGFAVGRPGVAEISSGGAQAQALLTGILVALVLSPSATGHTWYVPVTAVLLAVLVGQTLLGGHGNHLWHPAALARVGVGLLFGRCLTSAGTGGPAGGAGVLTPVGALVAMAAGDPRFFEPGRLPITVLVRDWLPPWGMTLFGGGAGGPTEMSEWLDVPLGAHAVGLIAAAILLGWRGHVRGWCILSALAGATLAACVLPIQLPPAQGGRLYWFPGLAWDEGLPVGLAYVLHHLTAGELLLVVLLLAGDSVTSPLTSRGQRWFGLGLGVLAIVLRLQGLADTAGYWALLAMNTLVPLIDRRTKRRVYGTGPEAQRPWLRPRRGL